jgi:hypothetical protein
VVVEGVDERLRGREVERAELQDEMREDVGKSCC